MPELGWGYSIPPNTKQMAIKLWGGGWELAAAHGVVWTSVSEW